MKLEINKLTSNQLEIINVLLKCGDLSKNKIAEKLNMKLTSLNNILYPMRSNGIIVESVYGESNGGRRPVLYSIPKEKYLFIGIDISIMYTMVVLADIKMNVIYSEKFTMDESYTCEKTIDKISQIIMKIQSEYDEDGNKILGVGLGTVGPIDSDKKVLRYNEDFFAEGWRDKNLKHMLEEKIHREVIWGNGVNAAILLEYLYGSGKSHNNIGYFNCGFGIRAGAISSNKIIQSMNNEEESFSKMLFSSDENIGIIGDYVTIKAINNNYMKKIGGITLNNSENLKLFREICREAEQGNTTAVKVIEDAAKVMSIGITNFIMLLNSDLIILSGPLIMSCPRFYDRCIMAVKENIKSKNIEFAKIGNYKDFAISLGAANMAVEKLLNKDF